MELALQIPYFNDEWYETSSLVIEQSQCQLYYHLKSITYIVCFFD